MLFLFFQLNSFCRFLDITTQVNQQSLLRGPPIGHDERIKKVTDYCLQERQFERLLQLFCVLPAATAVREMSGYTPIEVGVDVSDLASSSLKKRKLRNSDGQLVRKFGESSLGVASTAAIKSPSKTAVGSEDSLPEVGLRRRVTKRRSASVFRADAAMNPNIATPPATVVPSSELVQIAEVEAVVGGTSAPASPPFVPIEQPSETGRRLNFTALMKEHGVERPSYRASAAELEMAPIWHPRFGKDADRVFSTESTLFYDENEALDFIKGVGTPRDARFLEKKNEQSRHRSAQHYMLKVR